MFAYPSTMCWTCAHLYHKYVYIHRCFKANQKSSCGPNRVHTAHHIECWITYFVCCSKNSGKLLNLCVCFMHFDSMRSRCAYISKNFIYKHSPAHKRTQNPFVQKNGRNGAQQKGITKHIVYMQTRMGDGGGRSGRGKKLGLLFIFHLSEQLLPK